MSKAVIDRVVAALMVVLTAPLLLGVALAITVVDGGPVFTRQERVGRGGRTFRMIRFRSTGRVGRVLRRYSLDELPQMFNVLGGSMSLVGPRPPLARDARRLPMVRPGLTGLSSEERYVENWSLARDLTILRAAVRGRGAY